jgi:predicted nucleic acid-binding protein
VVDASVAAKWLLSPAHEPFADRAHRLLALYADQEIQIVVPDLFWAEIGNVLWKAARLGRCSNAEAKTGLQRVKAQNFPTVPSASLLDSAFEIACSSGRTIYDSLYIALAEASYAEFLTADEKLANALGDRYPIKWLGAL